ncbi:hypothetical protein PsorP6_004201 [Peronosclerospora sorghi]|uniref:Uncharacterized protein n=1 Tax=Peronosclerospora sorghi TaxID=230839 RepID=A0ACC0VPG5_9STRA|nr:hypothetical protein PsorP6_004201 [Peronosclerospora sorghi]
MGRSSHFSKLDVDGVLNKDNADNGRDENLSLFSEPISQPVSGPSNTQASKQQVLRNPKQQIR